MLSADWQEQLLQTQRLFVGFSGGLDSTVLLHHLATSKALLGKIEAVHVHHGLSPQASFWLQHCQAFCEALRVPLQTHHLNLNISSNIEAQAREARYGVFTLLLEENDALLLAHHADDQAETLLLQLFRGAGVDGLAAMPAQRPLGKGVLLRPLLQCTRNALETYAKQHQLSWIEDESNQDQDFRRNYLRHDILPRLQEKWPQLVNNLSRTAHHCQQAAKHVEQLASIDAADLPLSDAHLPLGPLKTLASDRLANVLRQWLKKNKVRMPSSNALQQLMDELIFVRRDAKPFLQWGEVSLRRYQDTLYLLKKTINLPWSPCAWSNFPAPLLLDGQRHVVQAKKVMRCGLRVPEGANIYLRPRQDGEFFYWRGQHKSLKKLFQQWCIPPWQREQVPLLFINDKLAMVVGFAIGDDYFCEEGSELYEVQEVIT